MKKIFLLLAIIVSVSFTVFAAEESEDTSDSKTTERKEGQSAFHYVNVPVLKILEAKNGYVVLYQKNKIGVGSTVLPKAWLRNAPGNPRKLEFRQVDVGAVGSFMTVIKKDGEFIRVVLTAPRSKKDPVWGILEYSKNLEGTDKETLEELDLY